MKDTHFDVCVVGLGYIGLPTAVFLAKAGLNVWGVDVNQGHVDKVNSGQLPFYEPGFKSVLKEVVESGNLKASQQPCSASAYIVAVPTPFKEGYELDDSYIRAASENLVPYLSDGALIVLESTSPPGTTEKMAEHITSLLELNNSEVDTNSLLFAHCPERVLPGKIMEELSSNARVIGGLNPEATVAASELYARFCDGEILKTTAATAELAKLTENSFRDVNIAFANELSMLCDEFGIDVWELISLANRHPRVNILDPGIGVGGHCIAVDPWFIVSASPKTAKIVRAAREVNMAKEEFVVGKIKSILNDSDDDAVFLGLAFKPDIDDLRESPAIRIVRKIVESYPERSFRVCEPNVEKLPPALSDLNNLELISEQDVLNYGQWIFKLVNHSTFKDYSNGNIVGKLISFSD